MNDNMLNVVKKIIEQYGEGILAEPRRVSAFFADLAQEIPKPQKNAFVKCLEHGFAQILKNATEPDRDLCKQQLAQKLHEEEGLDLALCGETLELLATVLFGEEQKKIYCKNCGKELQEGWKICPYCSTPVATKKPSVKKTTAKKPTTKTSHVISSAISSGSGSGGYGTETTRPISSTTANNAASQTQPPVQNAVDLVAGCNICHYKQTSKKGIICEYFSCGISEAIGYYCGMKASDSDFQTLRQKTATKKSIAGLFFFALIFGELILACVIASLSGLADALIAGISSIFISSLFFGLILNAIQEKRRKNAKRLSL